MIQIDYIIKRACELAGIQLWRYGYRDSGLPARIAVRAACMKLGCSNAKIVKLCAADRKRRKPSDREALWAEIIFNEVDQYRRARLK